jgi:3-oxoacyl-[acyl-carrier-protein] synthase I
VADIFITSHNIITSLGFTTQDNALCMVRGETGIRQMVREKIAPEPFFASLVDDEQLQDVFAAFDNPSEYTRFEKLAICSVKDALKTADIDPGDPGVLFILSTTKGNIDILEKDNELKFGKDRVYLWHTAKLLQHFFHFRNEPVIVSNACISGVQAILAGIRMIGAGYCDHTVINGTDIISEFVLSGFNSFKSLSNGPCRPFDKTRDGLSLGEGSGTIVLSKIPKPSGLAKNITTGQGFSSNDANHISGPSRTGEGLFAAINRVLEKSKVPIDYISAHGTATLYNDEMESIAITRAGLQDVPVNSFKGYWGHTLGAAGIIETVMCVNSMQENLLFPTLGFSDQGVTHPIAVINQLKHTEINNCLKIASGFGGCNVALLLHKK